MSIHSRHLEEEEQEQEQDKDEDEDEGEIFCPQDDQADARTAEALNAETLRVEDEDKEPNAANVD